MGQIKVIVKRQVNSSLEPYHEEYAYDGSPHISVLNLLEYINMNMARLAEKAGANRKLQYQSSCEQGLCGACAMVINGTPGLACRTFCHDIVDKSGCILLEPLSKFPVVSDLIVDRSIIYESMKELKLWVEGNAVYRAKSHNNQYQAAQCLQCGCCLEVCPSYARNDLFVGPVGAVNAMNVFQMSQQSEHKQDVKKQYKKKFYGDCVKTGACEKICPAEIPVLGVISESNYVSVWKIWQLFGSAK